MMRQILPREPEFSHMCPQTDALAFWMDAARYALAGVSRSTTERVNMDTPADAGD